MGVDDSVTLLSILALVLPDPTDIRHVDHMQASREKLVNKKLLTDDSEKFRFVNYPNTSCLVFSPIHRGGGGYYTIF